MPQVSQIHDGIEISSVRHWSRKLNLFVSFATIFIKSEKWTQISEIKISSIEEYVQRIKKFPWDFENIHGWIQRAKSCSFTFNICNRVREEFLVSVDRHGDARDQLTEQLRTINNAVNRLDGVLS